MSSAPAPPPGTPFFDEDARPGNFLVAEQQRLGIARQLVDAAVTEARQRGARKMTLRVLGRNTGARRVYERCGSVVEGVWRRAHLL
ncbi:GNAT family N-acetyltransferase [Amycolatopsis sp. NPDC021455]|uniref:GNAT family N-acetyltransferase n=1 Tax=Amycolatopsis sp. NPDC021455 TaxID=3154901 RepID=UPI0033DF25E1